MQMVAKQQSQAGGRVRETEEQAEQTPQKPETDAQEQTTAKQTADCDVSCLSGCRNVRVFRAVAKSFLLKHTDQIDSVIQAGMEHDDGSVHWELRQLRRNMSISRPALHKQLIKRALRGSNRRHNLIF
jgi:hypothetical protein